MAWIRDRKLFRKNREQLFEVRAETRSLQPLQRLELVVNGIVVRDTTPAAPFDDNIQLPESGWIAVRCWGDHQLPGKSKSQTSYAHTSPIYLQTKGVPVRVKTEAATRLDQRLEEMIGWVNRSGRFGNTKQKEDLLGIFVEARKRLFDKVNRAS